MNMMTTIPVAAFAVATPSFAITRDDPIFAAIEAHRAAWEGLSPILDDQ